MQGGALEFRLWAERAFALVCVGLIACSDKSSSSAEPEDDPVVDADSDGFPEDSDCDDQASAVHPDAVELCDELDNDCDGEVDEGVTSPFYADGDGDGFGVLEASLTACEAPAGYVAVSGDCDDSLSSVSPAEVEQCDELDNDCDGGIDEGVTTTFYTDADGDSFGAVEAGLTGCVVPEGYADVSGDCDDTEPATYPSAPTGCIGGADMDCDGLGDIYRGEVFFQSSDGTFTDLTAVFSAGTAEDPVEYSVSSPGDLFLCEGAWYATLSVEADSSVMGVFGAEATSIDAASTGSVIAVGGATTARIAGLTLTGGYAERGGGMFVGEAAVVEVEDCVLRGNTAFEYGWYEGGGGIFLDESTSATITDSIFEDNNSFDDGGGLFLNVGSSAALTGCTFEHNTAIDYGGAIGAISSITIDVADTRFLENRTEYKGGGIYLPNNTTAVITGSLFEGNTSDSNGGAIYSFKSSISIIDTVFAYNMTDDGNGGAMSMIQAYASLVRVDAYGNSADEKGGAISYEGSYEGDSASHMSPLSIEDSSFEENETVGYGGGIYLIEGGNVLIHNTSFVENKSNGTGGGIFMWVSDDVVIDGCSFQNNSTSEYGGGLSSFGSDNLVVAGSSFVGNESDYLGGGLSLIGSVAATIEGSVFEGNEADSYGGGAYLEGSSVTVSSTELQGNLSGVAGGGMLIFDGSTADIQGSTFYDNESATFGGGAYVYVESVLTASDSTFEQNRSYSGGALTVDWSEAALESCTLADNTSTEGGGVSLYQGGIASVLDSALSGNAAALYGGGVYIDDGQLAATSVDFSQANSPDDVYLSAAKGYDYTGITTASCDQSLCE